VLRNLIGLGDAILPVITLPVSPLTGSAAV